MSYLDEVLQENICPRCEQPGTDANPIDAQYSFGCYAGVMCKQCAISGFRDACGYRDEGQGTAAEYEELAGPGTYYEEE